MPHTDALFIVLAGLNSTMFWIAVKEIVTGTTDWPLWRAFVIGGNAGGIAAYGLAWLISPWAVLAWLLILSGALAGGSIGAARVSHQ